MDRFRHIFIFGSLNFLIWTLAALTLLIEPTGADAQLTLDKETPANSAVFSAPLMQADYEVEFLAEGVDRLTDAARQAIIDAMKNWTGTPPQSSTFYLVGLSWGSNWAIATLTSADLSDSPTPAVSLDELQDTRIAPHNLIALLLVETPEGWRAALDVDPAVHDLLAQVPLHELSQPARTAIFPDTPSGILREASVLDVQQAYNNYKLPWPAGHAWRRTRTGLGWHDGTWGGRFPNENSLDFAILNQTNSEILAAAPGVVTHICRVAGQQQAGIVIRTSGTEESLGYLHIRSASMPGGIYVGAQVQQGNILGDMVEGYVSETCGYSLGTHLHLYLPTRPFVMDGYAFTSTNTQGGVNLYSSQPLNGTFPTAPTNRNLVLNGDFSAGFDRWTTRLDTEQSIITESGDSFVAWRGRSGAAGVIAQNLNYAAPAGSVLEMDLELGNTTSTTRHLRVHLHRLSSSAIWDDMLVCDFYIPPNTPLQTYVLRRKITTSWENIRVWIEAIPADNQPSILTDNVRVWRHTTLEISGTQCFGPTPQTAWNFSGSNGPQGWTVARRLLDPRQLSGGMWYRVNDNDPQLQGPTLTNLFAEDYRYVRVVMASLTDECGRIYFQRQGQRGFPSNQYVAFTINPNGGTYTYAVDMRSNALWQGRITRLRLDPACDSGFNASRDNSLAIAEIRFSNLPPEFVMTTPAGILSQSFGNPVYSWPHISGAISYELYVAPANSISTAVFYETINTTYCDDRTCAIDATTLSGGSWLANGTYAAYLRLRDNRGFSEWAGPFTFTIHARVPDTVSQMNVTGLTGTSRPVFHWELPARAADAAWFRVYVAPDDNLGSPALDQWFSRVQVCGSLESTTCILQSPADLSNDSYSLYIQSWGPGGFSAGGLDGWAGPQRFTLTSSPPGLATDLVISGENTGRPTFTWRRAPGATWYQVWVGTPAPAYEMRHLRWYSAWDLGCATAELCSVRLGETLPNGSYLWYVQAWGAGGLSTGGALDGWAEGLGFTVLR